ncbi:hypothetical protein HYH02_005235 [Chlamydomonas schloesseri]|uniref:Origin recognition complex subunit 4 n=1 Tax=Chlamydomonas schloesseri TaxID=2026947 RepID=A0A836B7G5_9CHLO|nr:hypothetical protein HYH02_005235 [Chlamydomonas schloesseri]|eukprot:KAG2449708.1 hypothetical protein HYH02_005235 [Chlamydomonas schloesseri]
MQDSPAARRAGAACTAGPSSSAAAPANVEMWQRCCGVLREAVVDAGSAAAGLVPLRPSLRRIKDDLVRVLDEAVTSTNGNASLLVLGPQGTGKTLVVERALQEVCARHNSALAAASTSATAAATTTAAPPSDAPSTSSAPAPANASAASVAASVRNVGVVRLNGLLQPDERTAFQEVARQLCRDFGQRFVKSASFDENLVFLKGMLHALYKCLKKVVFVVDEFQQYAKKGKQQMLYYLLDMLQDSKIQAAVIGISAAHNVAEDLEKRVLSRVGRRRVVVTFPAREEDVVGGAAPGGSGSPGGSAAMRSPGGSATPATAAAGAGAAATAATDSYEGLLHDMLALHPGMAGLALAQQQPGAATAAAAAAATTEEHNAGLVAALRNPSVKKAVDKLEVIGSPPQHLALVAEAALVAWGADLAAAARAAGTRDAAAVPFSASHLLAGLRGVVDAPERAMVEAVSGLPVLALVLLVAAHRLQRKGQPMCNFEMVWDEYRSIQGQRGAIAFTKEAAAAAWQALPLCGLAHYSDAHLETRGRDLSYAGVVLLLGSAELEEGLRLHPHCPDAVTRFHMQEI